METMTVRTKIYLKWIGILLFARETYNLNPLNFSRSHRTSQRMMNDIFQIRDNLRYDLRSPTEFLRSSVLSLIRSSIEVQVSMV